MQLSVITASNVAYGEQLGEMTLKRCVLNVLITCIESMIYNFCIRIYNSTLLESRFKLQFSGNVKLKWEIDDRVKF